MRLKCSILAEGTVRDCLAERDVPYSGRVKAALEARSYRPATRNGVPIDVEYTFRVVLNCP